MPVIAQRLKHARLMRGFSLQDLADELDNKISRQALHKYEKGKVEPTNSMIQDIADTLDLKPDYFYRDREVEIKEVSFRKLSKLSKKEQNRIIETARDFLERYLELEQIIGKPTTIENPLKGIDIADKEDVERAAQQLRKKWELGTDPLYNVLELLEDQGIKIIEMEVNSNVDGLSTWIENSIPVIALNKSLKKHLDRYRFTTLHELGHLFLNIDQFSKKEQEKLCNHFAGAMLLDKRTIEQEIGLKRNKISLQELSSIKQQYGISIQAIIYRCRELKIISQKTYKSFFQFVEQNELKTDESNIAKYKGDEKALRFDQLLGQALAEEYITISKAAVLKNQRLTKFRKEFLLG
jgi:Zn-dependent peptidase ImmA (M78 family)/DNA-binding XRE family transcriptional regulator